MYLQLYYYSKYDKQSIDPIRLEYAESRKRRVNINLD